VREREREREREIIHRHMQRKCVKGKREGLPPPPYPAAATHAPHTHTEARG
jgi:hypothetical protein